MRAHANEFDGVDRYVDFVANGRYSEAWGYLLRGDAVAYVHGLKKRGYFTAPEDVYARGVVSLQREYLAKIRNEEPAPAVDLEWWKLRALVPCLQFDLAELVETPLGVDFPEAIT
jgi:hypothetical protein